MKRNKRIILCMLFIMTCMFAGAQNYMYVYKNDGNFVKYPVASIDSVTFAGLSLNNLFLDLNVGDEATLTASCFPANSLKWTSNNPAVSVEPNGNICKLKAESTGRATITVVSGTGLNAFCYVNVYETTNPEVIAGQDVEQLYYSFATNVASRGLGFIYVPLRAQFNLMGDDVYGAGSFYDDNAFMSDMSNYTFDASSQVVSDMYNGFQNAIKETNYLINLRKDATDAPSKKAVAEARTLRAYMYMMMAIAWGTPPLVDYVPAGEDLPYNCDKDPNRKMSRNDLFIWCAKECEAAVDDLDERKNTEDKEGAYKVTKGFAYSIAGKAYLFAQEYAKSKAALQKVIDSGKYALVPGDKYWENFHIEGDGNEEKIFEPNLEYDPAVGVWGGPNQKSTWMECQLWNWRSDHFKKAPQRFYTGGVDGWGGLGVPQWFGDEFLANDGHSYRFDATLKRIDDAVYNMKYGEEEIDNLTLELKKASTDIGINNNGLYGQSFYLPFKQLMRAEDTQGAVYGNNVRLNNYTIMRFAEVLLMYAEACVETGDSQSALRVINMIQRRAGSQSISTTVDMDVIKREKSYEMWLEGCRWADIIRWGDTDRIKQSGQNIPILYDKLFRTPMAGYDEDVTWMEGENSTTGRFYTVSSNDPMERYTLNGIGFKENKHELLPYPASVIESNPNITQNPGW